MFPINPQGMNLLSFKGIKLSEGAGLDAILEHPGEGKAREILRDKLKKEFLVDYIWWSDEVGTDKDPFTNDPSLYDKLLETVMKVRQERMPKRDEPIVYDLRKEVTEFIYASREALHKRDFDSEMKLAEKLGFLRKEASKQTKKNTRQYHIKLEGFYVCAVVAESQSVALVCAKEIYGPKVSVELCELNYEGGECEYEQLPSNLFG